LQELLSKKEFPADVEGSRRLIEEHTQLKKKVRICAVLRLADLSSQTDNRLLIPHSLPGAEGSSGGAGPGGPEAASVHPI